LLEVLNWFYITKLGRNNRNVHYIFGKYGVKLEKKRHFGFLRMDINIKERKGIKLIKAENLAKRIVNS
jgi:hypothetical protein